MEEKIAQIKQQTNADDYLDSHNWDRWVASPIADAQLDEWQEKLNKIVGTEPDGTVRLRFVWGGDLRRTQVWDRYAQVWYPRYWFARRIKEQLNPATGVMTGVYEHLSHVPRFFCEALVYHPADARAMAAGSDADGQRFTSRPVEAQYVTAFPILQHSLAIEPESGLALCCYNLLERNPKLKCFGSYRPIDEADITYITEEYKKRERHWAPKPGEALTSADKRKLFLEEMGWWKEQKENAQAEIDYIKRTTLDDLIRLKHSRRLWSLPG